jgi:hypothetical protein
MPTQERATLFAAFGLLLEVDPRIDVAGLARPRAGAPDGGAAPTPTRVSLDPAELERRWAPVGTTARRMRELHQGDRVVLSVDLAESAGYLLQAVGVGRVLISPDGTELLCDPLPESPEWTFILPAQALPLAATLRGLEVFHAAAVVLGPGAVLIAGDPGAGKSSLAAALVRNGAPFLGDDAIALEPGEDGLVAHPSVAALYLRSAEYDRLSSAEREVLGSPELAVGKRRYGPETAADAVPFGALFLLERADRGAPIERIEEVDPFALLAATFNLSVRTPERLTRQLDVIEGLVRTGRVFRLRVLPGLDATRLAEAVERYLAAVAR